MTVKKTLTAVSVALLTVFLFSCKSSEASGLALSVESLKTDEVGYCYNGLSWETDEAEFEKNIGVDLSSFQKLEDAETSKTVYVSENTVNYSGNSGYGTIEFVEGKLKSVTFTFSDSSKEKVNELFNKLTEECEKNYGTASDTSENSGDVEGIDITSNTLSWNTETSADGSYTSLQVMTAAAGTDYTVTIGVAEF